MEGQALDSPCEVLFHRVISTLFKHCCVPRHALQQVNITENCSCCLTTAS